MSTQHIDKGVKSRKLWYCAGTSVAIVIASLFVSAAVIGEVIAGLIAVCLIYTGGQQAVKVLTARYGINGATQPDENTPPAKKLVKKEEEPHLGE